MIDLNLSLDQVVEMDDKSLYDLADNYLKRKFSDYAAYGPDKKILQERNARPENRSEAYEALSREVRNQIKGILYDPEVIPRYRLTLQRMASSVHKQLNFNEGEDRWRAEAQGFLDMVNSEIAYVIMEMDDIMETTYERMLETLLKAIQEHRNADDPDEADDRLYDIADQITEEFTMENS